MKTDKQPAKYIAAPRLSQSPAQIYFNPELFGAPINLLGFDFKWKSPATKEGPGKVREIRGATVEDIDLIYEYESKLGVLNPQFRLNPEWERWNAKQKAQAAKAKKEDNE